MIAWFSDCYLKFELTQTQICSIQCILTAACYTFADITETPVADITVSSSHTKDVVQSRVTHTILINSPAAPMLSYSHSAPGRTWHGHHNSDQHNIIQNTSIVEQEAALEIIEGNGVISS